MNIVQENKDELGCESVNYKIGIVKVSSFMQLLIWYTMYNVFSRITYVDIKSLYLIWQNYSCYLFQLY